MTYWPVASVEFGEHQRWDSPLGLITVRRNLRSGWWDAHPVEDVALLRQLAHDYPCGDTPEAALNALLAWVADNPPTPEVRP